MCLPEASSRAKTLGSFVALHPRIPSVRKVLQAAQSDGRARRIVLLQGRGDGPCTYFHAGGVFQSAHDPGEFVDVPSAPTNHALTIATTSSLVVALGVQSGSSATSNLSPSSIRIITVNPSTFARALNKIRCPCGIAQLVFFSKNQKSLPTLDDAVQIADANLGSLIRTNRYHHRRA